MELAVRMGISIRSLPLPLWVGFFDCLEGEARLSDGFLFLPLPLLLGVKVPAWIGGGGEVFALVGVCGTGQSCVQWGPLQCLHGWLGALPAFLSSSALAFFSSLLSSLSFSFFSLRALLRAFRSDSSSASAAQSPRPPSASDSVDEFASVTPRPSSWSFGSDLLLCDEV